MQEQTPRNRLGAETSPYLLQHKNNPVHWRPWARRRSPRPAPPASRSCSRSGLRRLPLGHVMAP